MGPGDRSFVVHERGRLAVVAVALALAAAAYLTVGLAVVLPSSEYGLVRLTVVAVAAAFAWAGVVGAVFDRPPVVIAAAVALLLLGVWQTVLWVFMLPASLGLAVAGVVLAHSP
jgi:hypothetical protein